MALTIYMDVHIPAAITDGLRRNAATWQQRRQRLQELGGPPLE